MSLEMRTDTKTSEKSKSNIWKYFTKERGQDNKITAKCNYCNAKYVVIKASTKENLQKWLTNWIILKDLSFIIKTLGKLLLSLDIWLTVVKLITVHFIDNSWYLQQITLDFIELEDSYTEKNIAEELITVLNLYDISKKINSITTDNASNNNIMFKSYFQIPLSSQRCKKFSEISKLNGVDDLLPIFDVPTCWNFTYDMVINQSDWTSLENIAAFLRCFTKLSTEIYASTYPTISTVYPMYNLFMGHALMLKKMNKDKTSNNIALVANVA
ncbi:unnamed protein product [Rhizophagus irregularis]|nr:unnamed protein product [Rhizophagus irregularis]